MCDYRKGYARRSPRERFFGHPKRMGWFATAFSTPVPSDQAWHAVWVRNQMPGFIFLARRMLVRLNGFYHGLQVIRASGISIGTRFSSVRPVYTPPNGSRLAGR